MFEGVKPAENQYGSVVISFHPCPLGQLYQEKKYVGSKVPKVDVL